MAEADPGNGAVTAMPDRAPTGRCVEAMGFAVYNGDLADIPLRRPCSTIQTISPISYGMAQGDPLFREALRNADWLCLDGVYFGLAGIVLKGRRTRPNQGPDIFDHFMRRLNAEKGRAFFLGASEATLARIKERAAREFPDIAVDTYSPPFRAEFTPEDNDAMIAAIHAARPATAYAIGVMAAFWFAERVAGFVS